MEEWRPIDHYPYEVSNLGRVRRIVGIGVVRLLTQNVAPKRNGSYLKVDLWKWGRRKVPAPAGAAPARSQSPGLQPIQQRCGQFGVGESPGERGA